MKSVLCNKNISFSTRYRVLKCYIYPVFEYNSESWTIHKRIAERINAFEMWALCRMQRITWTARTTNEEVLHQVDKTRSLLKNIKRRQLIFVGHVLRKGKLEHLSLTGRIDGKCAPGRQRLTYLKQHTNNDNNAAELIQKSYDRQIWQSFPKEAVDAWNQAWHPKKKKKTQHDYPSKKIKKSYLKEKQLSKLDEKWILHTFQTCKTFWPLLSLLSANLVWFRDLHLKSDGAMQEAEVHESTGWSGERNREIIDGVINSCLTTCH